MGDLFQRPAGGGYSSRTRVQKLRIAAVFGCVQLTAFGCLAYLASSYPIAPLFDWSALFWLILALIASYSSIPVYTTGTPNTVSVGFTVHAAILVLFNPLAAAVLVALGTLDQRDFTRQRRFWLTLYNRAMFVVCVTAATLLFNALAGGRDVFGDPPLLLAKMAAVALLYFVVNTFLVRAIVAAIDNEAFFARYPFKGDLLVGYLFQAVVAMILVYLARQSQALAVLVVGPLWGLRFSLQKLVELREVNEQLVQSFADALDMRDHDTAGHTRRVATLARLIGAQMGLNRRQLDSIYAAGSLHDLGKIGMPDSILLKPGPLARDEWDEMKKHPIMGASLLAPYRHLHGVTDIMHHHHERYDGGGYPDGLTGEDVPIGARVIAVADTFMVITDGRQYRSARSVEEAVAEIERCSGTQFDPKVVAAFIKLNPATVLSAINTLDVHDDEAVFRAIAPNPVWSRLLGFKAA